MPKLQPGANAPQFSLKAHDGSVINLAQTLQNYNVVLIFYPKDQTPICTKQLCTARDDATIYAQANIRVLGVNGGNAQAHSRFAAKQQLTMPLLIDQDLTVAQAYDAIIQLGGWKFINRTVVGINQAGKIVFFQRGTPKTADIVAAFA